MDWKKIIGSVAPLLGGTIGGPFGALAGQFIADGLGVSVGEIEATVTDPTPETLFKLKQLDADFKVKMEELGLAQEQLHADDRASAREMATNTTLLPQAILSGLFIIGFIITLYAVFSGGVSLEGNTKDAAMFLLGILSAGIIQIMNFWFGSSSGSKEKTIALANK